MTRPFYRKWGKNWASLIQFNRQYWRIYGGFRSLLFSPYLHLAVIFAVLLTPLWREAGWWDVSISLTSSMLGFTLGGFALIVSLGSSTLVNVLSKVSKKDESPLKTPYMKVAAVFVHFIVIQVLTLVWALLSKATSLESFPSAPAGLRPFISRDVFWWMGGFLTIYSLFLVVSTSQYVFTLIRAQVKFAKRQFHESHEKSEDQDS